MMFTFLENALNLGVFTHVPLLPTQNSPQREIAHFPRQLFFEKQFSPTAEKCGANYDLIYQNSIRKYEDDLKH